MHQTEAMQREIDSLKAELREQYLFVGKALHNLNNLITRIAGCDQYILSTYADVLDEVAQNFLIEANKSCFSMNDIFRAMNTIVEVRSKPVTPVRLDMGPIVRAAISSYEKTVAALDGTLTYPTDWPVVCGDAYFVDKVWRVYLSNALKYSPASPHITLSAAALPTEQLVKFSVHDEGIGLTEAQQALMFMPFPGIQRDDPNAGGLGLFMARLIIERLGGTVGVESQIEHGSTFSFTLPTERQDGQF